MPRLMIIIKNECKCTMLNFARYSALEQLVRSVFVSIAPLLWCITAMDFKVKDA